MFRHHPFLATILLLTQLGCAGPPPSVGAGSGGMAPSSGPAPIVPGRPVAPASAPAVTFPAGLGAGAGSEFGGMETPEPYRYLGRSHYEGKVLLDLEAEFDQLAIAPTGKQVVFRGRESRDAYELFVADLDGSIRLLAPTDREPQHLHWSNDETTLLYLTQETTREGMAPGAPPDIPGIPSGMSLHHLTLASGQDRNVLELPGMGAFFPSPTNEYAAVYGFTGYGGSKIAAPFDLVDVATGQRRALGGDVQEIYLTYAGQWHPDGRRLAVIDALRPPAQGMRVLTYTAPEWTPTEVMRGLAWPGQLWWAAKADTLETFRISENDELVFEALATGVAPRPFLTVPLEAAPAGFRFEYGAVLPSPARGRYLIRRGASSTAPQVLAAGEAAPPAPANLLIDRRTGVVEPVAPGLTAIGWLEEGRLLAYAGKDQRKRLVVVSIGGS